MRRCDFIQGIAGSTAGWPLSTLAEQAAKQPTIGFLGTNTS